MELCASPEPKLDAGSKLPRVERSYRKKLTAADGYVHRPDIRQRLNIRRLYGTPRSDPNPIENLPRLDRAACARGNRTKRFFKQLKQKRRIAICYDPAANSFVSFVCTAT